MGEQISAFDKATESAWSRFRARLADHVAEMTDADILIIDTDPFDEIDDGAAPYVQFCAWGQTRVRCEVSSNEFLGEAHRLDDDAGSANFHLDVERLEADRLVVMAVRALRECSASCTRHSWLRTVWRPTPTCLLRHRETRTRRPLRTSR